jgi:hypothetical protein
MDPITLIVTALAAGAALGLKDTASSAVRDAYAGLNALVTTRLAGRPGAEIVLSRYEEAPQTWHAPLVAELDEAGAGDDLDLAAAAQVLMNLVDETGARAGKYTVDVRGAQGVQIGDHTRQDNVFYAPPSGLGYPEIASHTALSRSGISMSAWPGQEPVALVPAADSKGAVDEA